jgi:hypothetical protein
MPGLTSHPDDVHPAPAGQAAAACRYSDVCIRPSAAALAQAAWVDNHHLRAGRSSCSKQQESGNSAAEYL